MRIAVVGTELAGLAAATQAMRLGDSGTTVDIFDPRAQAGGVVQWDDTYGSYGSGFLIKPESHLRQTEVMGWWCEGMDNFSPSYIAGPNDCDSGYFAPSGPMLYRGLNGEPFDATAVDEGIAQWRKEYIPKLLASLGLDEMGAHQLSPFHQGIQRMSVARWMDAEPLPGVKVPFPKLHPHALSVLKWLTEHDNGFRLEEQNVLQFARLLNFGPGYWSGSSEVTKEGGKSIVDKAIDWLEARGAKISLNTSAQLRDAADPTLYFSDGSSQRYDRVFLATPPTTWDSCVQEPRLRMGNSLFWNILLKEDFVRDMESADATSPHFEAWFSMLKKNVLVVFAGGGAYAAASVTPPFAALEKVFPGISAAALSWKTRNWPQEPHYLGSFSGVRPGEYEAVLEQRARAATSDVVPVGEWLSDLFGYPAGGIEQALSAVETSLSR